MSEFLNDPQLRSLLERILKKERENLRKYQGRHRDWECIEVGADPWEVRKLIKAGLVECTYKSSKHTFYQLTVPHEELEKLLQEHEAEKEAVQYTPKKEEKIPKDLFDVISGYDDIKKVFRKSLRVSRHHILLVGPPASGKTLFLLEVARLPNAYYILGGSTTKAGLSEILFNTKPRYILIDEMDKMTIEDYTVLLSLCETGIVKYTKYGRHKEIKLNSNVYAAANRIDKIPEEVLSRFMVFHVPPYTEEELVRAIMSVLTKREGKDMKFASAVAEAIIELGSRDVRDAIKLARLCSNLKEVEEVKEIWKKYKLKRWYT